MEPRKLKEILDNWPMEDAIGEVLSVMSSGSFVCLGEPSESAKVDRVLAALSDQPTKATELADRLGLPLSDVMDALHILKCRSQVEADYTKIGLETTWKLGNPPEEGGGS